MAILAYIDAGSGSMILQVLLASALAVPFFFRRTISGAWRRLRGGGREAARDGRTIAERSDH